MPKYVVTHVGHATHYHTQIIEAANIDEAWVKAQDCDTYDEAGWDTPDADVYDIELEEVYLADGEVEPVECTCKCPKHCGEDHV